MLSPEHREQELSQETESVFLDSDKDAIGQVEAGNKEKESDQLDEEAINSLFEMDKRLSVLIAHHSRFRARELRPQKKDPSPD